VDYSDVPFDGEAAGMLTVAEARTVLAATEPIEAVTFWTGDPGIEVTYGKGWYEAGPLEAAPAWLTVPDGTVYQLTRQAADQLGSTAKVNKKFQEFLPPALLSAVVTWALREGLEERELKLFIAGTGRSADDTEDVPLAVAQTRATIVPFSNLRLLDIVLLAVRSELGNEAADSALVDYKLYHDLEHTSFRVVVPAAQTVLAATGDTDDAWCFGIEVTNSLIGFKQTVISGYLFNFASTAGITDVEHSAGGFNRRGSGPEDVYAWAAESATDILSRLEEAFNGLEVIAAAPLPRDYQRVLAQLFRDSPVSKELKLHIISALEETPGDLRMYDLATAAAVTANLPGSTWRDVRSLHDLAGHIVHQGGGMCDGSLPRGCRRLLPDDLAASETEAA
jgi:hypothetical protein